MDPIISHMLNLLRIAATSGIFVYHFFTLAGNNIDILFVTAILIFCFLTGYLSHSVYQHPLKWLIRRFYSIMVPYWFVIIPALLCNRLISYKETNLTRDLASLLGGSLFVDDRVYVISWYVTFVLFLYLFVFILTWAKNGRQVFLTWTLALLFFGLLLEMLGFFMAFTAGLLFAGIRPPPPKKISRETPLGEKLFFLQDKCYTFFLIHGAVLLFFFKTDLITQGAVFFVLALLVSGLGALFLRKLTAPLVSIMIKKSESTTLFKTYLPE